MSDQPENPSQDPANPEGTPAQGQPAPEQPTQPYFIAPQGQTPPPPPGGHYTPVYYPASAAPPSNNSAVASIVVASSSLALLFLSAGLAAPFTAIASTIATFLGHKGREDVDQGKTTVQRDLAVAGFWTGIGGVVLSIMALIIWVALVIFLVGQDSFWDELEREFDDPSNWE